MTRDGKPTVMRILRERKGMTQEELADLLKCRQPAVSAWESLSYPVSDTLRAAIAKILDVDPAWLLRPWDEFVLAGKA